MLFLTTLFCALPLAFARPTGTVPRGDNETSTADPMPVDAARAATFVRPAHFASLAYCSTKQLSTSAIDKVVPGVELLQSGGDGGATPVYYIAHDPENQSIVVAHEGTDPTNLLSIKNDLAFKLADLNSMRFQLPNQDGVQVHDGFQKTFERTADAVLAGVTSALKSKNVSKIDIAGHSLGAALATMDALMFKQHLPDVQMSITLFGLPRGGNQEFADLVNANLGSTGFTFITNQHDPVPEVPPRFLGYVHPQGEVHILDDDAQGNAKTIVACPGQENEHCSEGNSLLDASVQNHLGPYFQGIKMSAPDCPLGAN